MGYCFLVLRHALFHAFCHQPDLPILVPFINQTPGTVSAFGNVDNGADMAESSLTAAADVVPLPSCFASGTWVAPLFFLFLAFIDDTISFCLFILRGDA